MDFVIFGVIALISIAYYMQTTSTNDVPEDVVEDIKRQASVNTTFYKDENAFCEIVNALGYNNIGGKL